jgi:WD40 repeat protein
MIGGAMNPKIFLTLSLVAALFGGAALPQEHGAAASLRTSPDCEFFPIGNRKVSPLDKKYIRSTFSPDGKRMAVGTFDDNVALIDVATGRELFKLSLDNYPRQLLFSPDGKRLLIGAKSGTVTVVDTATGGVKGTLKNPQNLTELRISQDGKFGLSTDLDGTAQVFDVETGRGVVKLKDAAMLETGAISGNGKLIATANEKGVVALIEIPSGKVRHTFNRAGSSNLLLSSKGRFLAIQDDSQVAIYEAGTGRQVRSFPVKNNSTEIKTDFSADEKRLLVTFDDGSTKEIDLHSGAEIRLVSKIPHSQHGRWAAGEKEILIHGSQHRNESSHREWTEIRSSESGRLLYRSPTRAGYLGADLSADGTKLLSTVRRQSESESNCTVVDSLERFCADPVSRLSADQPPSLPSSLKNTLTEECGADFNLAKWDRLLPAPKGRAFNPGDAELYLLRFQKPGGFEPVEHLNLFLAMLRSADFVRGHRAAILRALQTLPDKSPLLYEAILDHFPLLTEDVEEMASEAACQSKAEAEALTNQADRYARDLLAVNALGAKLSEWKGLIPLRSSLARLPAETRHQLMQKVAERVAEGAALDSLTRGIFQSKLHYFAEDAIRPWFGEKRRGLTDFTLVREKSKLKPRVLGAYPIDGDSSTLSDYGFYVKALRDIPLPKKEDAKSGPLALHGAESVSWTQQGKRYSADLSVNVFAIKELVDKSKSPPYARLKKNGIIVSGTNLRELAPDVLGEYLQYFKDEGFEFSGKPKEIPELFSFLQDQIESGEAGYLLKEAHSDGDEKNLFRIDRSALQMVGTNPQTGEKVTLVFPGEGTHETRLIGNSTFGEWVRKREQKGNGPLVYFNTSCRSDIKAVNEIEAAYTKGLINLASENSVYTFSNRPTNAMYLMLSAYRKEKSYEEIRQELEKNQDYKLGIANGMMFPDEDRYDRRITQVIEVPLSIDIVTKAPNGARYNLDQVGRDFQDPPMKRTGGGR